MIKKHQEIKHIQNAMLGSIAYKIVIYIYIVLKNKYHINHFNFKHFV